MADSSDIRHALQGIALFIVYRLVPTVDKKGRPKLDKIPTDPLTGGNLLHSDRRTWMPPEEAMLWEEMLNSQPMPEGVIRFGVGVIVSEDIVLPNGRRLFCLDLDKCRDEQTNQWKPHASVFLAKLQGSGVEVSVSGNGLHAFGTYAGERPAHGTRNKDYGLELYSRGRFIAVTGAAACGDPLGDFTKEFTALAEGYFPPHDDIEYAETLTDKPVPEWSGPDDDEELLRRAMRSHGAAQIFGGKASFASIWNADENILPRVFPPQQNGMWDGSAADLALANHLAFWTGNNGERMLRLMWRSQLVRDKWYRTGYLHDTIQYACGSQRQWYSGPGSAVQAPPAPPATLVAPPAPATPAVPPPPSVGVTFGPMPADVTPPPPAGYVPLPPGSRPPLGEYLTTTQQIALFDNCVYVQDVHQIMMPQGHMLSSEKFDAEFAGYTFAVTPDGQRPAKRAWEAFVFSETHAFPKVKGVFFDPRLPPGTESVRDGWTLMNSYVPSIIVRKAGDATPFLTHLHKLLPLGQDAEILLAYFAACVQHAGEKFQWWPLIQGVEGNGKTTLSYLLEYAVGERYTHWPKASQLGSKFNSAFYGKLLICVEDVKITESKGSLWDALKPMITGAKMEIEGKGVDQVTREICFNGVMNSNHKDAIRKTKNDRRLGPFFCAQQYESDLLRDGMDEQYFKVLRAWRMGEGREIVADYLSRYQIPDKWNPTIDCTRCPTTTATKEALRHGLGTAEQEVVEAIEQHRLGFRGGWISSTALDVLLTSIGKGTTVARNKRRDLLESLGYSPHRALPDGRSTAIDTDGSRPHLYCLPTAQGASETNAGAVMGWYQKAQQG